MVARERTVDSRIKDDQREESARRKNEWTRSVASQASHLVSVSTLIVVVCAKGFLGGSPWVGSRWPVEEEQGFV